MQIKTAFVGTDYTCSPGTADSDLEYYFIPDASLTEEFAACGVPRERIVPSGMPARPDFIFHVTPLTLRRQSAI